MSALVLALAFAFFFVGCDKASSADVSSDDPPATTTGNENPDMTERIDVTKGDEPLAMNELEKKEMQKIKDAENSALEKDNRQPYDTLISASYPEQKFFENSIINWFFFLTAGFQQSFYLMQEEYGYTVECLRRTDDTSAYCIFKTDEGGLVYCFFKEEYSSWYLHNAVYVKNALTKDAFTNIGVGSSLRDVSNVDNLVDVYEADALKWQTKEFLTIHLLKDCLVLINFSSDNGQFVVTDIRYFDDFKFERHELGGWVYDYTILPQDYPG
jgi:hypothetical protein